jgi:amino acid transporter
VISASVLAVSSYLGFDSITTLAEEVQGSARKIKVAIFLALSIQTVLYFAMSYFGTIVVPDPAVFADPDTAFYGIAYKVGGSALQIFITILILISSGTTALAGQAAASRLLYGMGRDELIPRRFFAYLHPTYKTPVYNVLLMGVVSIVGSFILSFANLADMVAFGGLFGFICVNLSVICHYYIKNKCGKIVRHVIFPLLGIIICGYILFGMSSLARTVGFSWIGAGIIYLVVRSLASQDFKCLLENNSLVNPEAACELDD